jgi:hypothetical protein
MPRTFPLGMAVALAGACLNSTATFSWAQTGPPTNYFVTLNTVKFSTNDDGTSGFVEPIKADGSTPTAQEFDIRSANTNTELGNYFGGDLPPGNYKRMQITISCNFRLKGELTSGGVTYRTVSDGTTCQNPPTNCGDPGLGTFTIPTPPCSGGTVTAVSPSGVIDFTYDPTKNQCVKAFVDINTENALELSGGNLRPGNVSASMSFQAVPCQQ